MKKKLDLAHEYAMAFIVEALKDDIESDFNYNLIAINSWSYADAMYEQLEKRESKGTPEAISSVGATDVSDWQPDWSQAPDDAMAWVKRNDGFSYWCDGNRKTISKAPSFNYQGHWTQSLRKHPVNP